MVEGAAYEADHLLNEGHPTLSLTLTYLVNVERTNQIKLPDMSGEH